MLKLLVGRLIDRTGITIYRILLWLLICRCIEYLVIILSKPRVSHLIIIIITISIDSSIVQSRSIRVSIDRWPLIARVLRIVRRTDEIVLGRLDDPLWRFESIPLIECSIRRLELLLNLYFLLIVLQSICLRRLVENVI